MIESTIYEAGSAAIYGPVKVEDDMDVIKMIMKANLNGFIEGLADSDEVTKK